MYKMCNTQWDEESEDDKNSLNSSFWSDGENQGDDEEEEVEIKRLIDKDSTKPAAEDFLQDASEEETIRPNLQTNVSEENVDDSDESRSDAGSCSGSPAPSLMTSGYGTYRPDDFRDNHTITEFDQDSRGDFSEMRDDYDDDDDDDRSLSGFGGFDIEDAHEPEYETRPAAALQDDKPEANASCCEEDPRHEDINITHMKPEELGHPELFERSENKKVSDERSEGRHHITGAEDELLLDGNKVRTDPDEEEESLQPDEQDLNVEREVEDKAESDLDESSSNKDIKFIDSTADSSWMMLKEWDGNLRQKKGKPSLVSSPHRSSYSSLQLRASTGTSPVGPVREVVRGRLMN